MNATGISVGFKAEEIFLKHFSQLNLIRNIYIYVYNSIYMFAKLYSIILNYKTFYSSDCQI